MGSLAFLLYYYFLWRLKISSRYTSLEVCLLQREAITWASCGTELTGGTVGQVGHRCCFPKYKEGQTMIPYIGAVIGKPLCSAKKHVPDQSVFCVHWWLSRDFSPRDPSKRDTWLCVTGSFVPAWGWGLQSVFRGRNPGLPVLSWLWPELSVHL